MPFILLEIAMQATALADAIDPDPSEGPENRPDGSSEMSDGRDDEFQRESQAAPQRVAARNKESN
jgi:hypothetical protein